MIGTSILGLNTVADLGISKTMGGSLYHLLFSLSIFCGILIIAIALSTRILKRILR